MHDSQLVLLLRKFDKKQLKSLRKYLLSPFFNENGQVSNLFEYIVGFAPDYQHKDLERKTIFKLFFPKEVYEKNDGAALRKLINSLSRLVEAFIEYQTGQGIPYKSLNRIHSLEFYIEQNLEKQFRKVTKSIQQNNKVKRLEVRSMDHYYMKHLLEIKEFDFFSSKDLRKGNTALLKGIDDLEHYYTLSKLQLYCLSVCTSRVIQSDANLDEIQAFLDQIQEKQVEETPFIQLYYYALSFLVDHSKEEYFEAYKDLLSQHIHLFPHVEARQLYVYAKNFCIIKTKEGKTEYQEKFFELSLQELKQGIIYANGKLLYSYFKKLIDYGIQLNKLDWVEAFIERNQDKIIAENPKDIYLFSKATLAFSRKNYGEVLDLLKFTKFKDFYYKLSARTLLLKVYYETNEIDVLDSDLHALKMLMYRDQTLSKQQQLQYKNFCNLLEQIAKTVEKDQNRIEKLLQKINSTKALISRDWLLEKLEELT